MENAKERLAQAVKEAEEIVYSYLPAEEGHQKTIFEAMNYSVKAGGKRLRPILMREVYRLFGGQGKEIEPLMAAIEMIHTSSLIHDDLPCMDNDEYRRGKKTTWVAYGYDLRDQDGGKGICDDAGCGKGGTLYPDFIRKNGYLRHDRRSDGGCGTDESADSEG